MNSNNKATKQPMPKLPDTIEPYKKTALFNQHTVPKGLLQNHSTKARTWGVLNVLSGSLHYKITDPSNESEHVVDVNHPAIIMPEQEHHIQMTGDVEFYIEFHREPTSSEER